MTFNAGDRLLFQGDSITDAGRIKGTAQAPVPPNDMRGLGRGYVALAAAQLLADHPDKALQVVNRGISGNRVTDLRGRWQADCIALEPTVLSILVGVNDTWHGIARRTPENGTDLTTYEQELRQLITTTRDALPDVRFVLCEPFTTQAGAVLELAFHPDIDERRAIAARVADDAGTIFVPFQQLFDYLSEKAPPAYWAADGVHPTPAGHAMMARFWMQTFRERN